MIGDAWLAGQFARPSGMLGRLLITPLLNRVGRRLNVMAMDLLEVQPGEAVLEIGYGGGGLLRRLAKARLGRLVGVDVSTALPGRIAGAELVRSEASALPFPDASFDGVVTVSVLHFWHELDSPLREIARVLRPGGRLVLVFEPPEALQRWSGHRFGFELWSEAAVICAAAEVGFVLDERREGQGRMPDWFVGLRLRMAIP